MVTWLIVVTVLLIVTIVGNYCYRDYHCLCLRALAVVIIAIAVRWAIMTAKGKSFVQFAREARNEVRKLIWPTYQETFYATLIVIVVTTVISLILWGLDGLLVRVVSFIHSLRLSDV